MPGGTTKNVTLPDLSIRIMLSVLRDVSLDTQLAFQMAGMPEGLPNPPGDVLASQEFAFQKAFASLTGHRPDLWLETGRRYHLPSYRQLGMALMTSRDLRDMVNTSLLGRPLDYSLAEVSLLWNGDDLYGVVLDVGAVPEELREFTLYRDLGAMLTALNDVWKGEFPVRQIDLAASRFARANLLVRGNVLRFGAAQTAVLWDGCNSHRRLSHSDPIMHKAYLEEIRIISELRDGEDGPVDVLMAALRNWAGGPLTLPVLAAEIGSSERTLQRRLRARGVRFRDLADEARRRVALDLLTTTTIPIAEIAWRLGYSETTSFNHAFRRWAGTSPAQVRRRDREKARSPSLR